MAKKRVTKPKSKLSKLKHHLEEEKGPEEKKNLIFEVPVDVHQKFKDLAAEEGISMNKLFRAMVRRLFQEAGI